MHGETEGENTVVNSLNVRNRCFSLPKDMSERRPSRKELSEKKQNMPTATTADVVKEINLQGRRLNTCSCAMHENELDAFLDPTFHHLLGEAKD